MKDKSNTGTRRGGLGMSLLLCSVAAALGVGLDFVTASGQRFWFDDRPGVFALFGAGLALAAVVCGHIMRILLGRRLDKPEEAPRADA